MVRSLSAVAVAMALTLAQPALSAEIIIKLTDEQAKAQIALNDAAVKALGLQAAEAGLVLTRIIQQAMAETSKPAVAAPAEPAKADAAK